MSFHPRIEYATFHRSERKLAELGDEFRYTAEHQAIFDELVTHYPPDQRKSAILYALFLVQKQQGYVSGASMRFVADQIRLHAGGGRGCRVVLHDVLHEAGGEVRAERLPDAVVCAHGRERVTEELTAKLGIAPGQTTPDGMFTLMEVECLGACDRAPVLMINDDGWHERLAPEQARQFVDDLRARGYTALSGCHLHVEKSK